MPASDMIRVISLLALFAVAAPLWAATPEECVKAYYAATAKQGLTATLDLIHPDDLKIFRDFAEQFRDRIKEDKSAEAFVDPAMRDKSADGQALSDRDWAARLMPTLERMQESILQLRKTSDLDVIGHVPEGDLRYVIIRWRMKMLGTEVVKLAVATTKLHNGEPMMLMPEELMQMARLMSAQFGRPSGPGSAGPPANPKMPLNSPVQSAPEGKRP